MPNPRTTYRFAPHAAVASLLVAVSFLAAPLHDGAQATAARKQPGVSALWKAFPLGAKAAVAKPHAVVHPAKPPAIPPVAAGPASTLGGDTGGPQDESVLVAAAMAAIAAAMIVPAAVRRRRRRGAPNRATAGVPRLWDAGTGRTVPAWVVESRQRVSHVEAPVTAPDERQPTAETEQRAELESRRLALQEAELEQARAELEERRARLAGAEAEAEQRRRNAETEYVARSERLADEEARCREWQQELASSREELENAARALESERATLARRLDSLAFGEADLAERERSIAEREAHALTSATAPHAAPAELCDHLLFIASPDGYHVIERAGALPDDQAELQLALEGSDDRRYVVSRIGRSPIPHDDRPCAFLEPAA